MGVRPGPAGLDFWSPNINIFRDPRWGRGQETYGEDPFLTGRLGTAFVRGLQGDDPKYFKTIATPKHFAVHSGPEPTRHTVDVKVSLHDMEDTYLPAFRQTVVEGQGGFGDVRLQPHQRRAGLRQHVPARRHAARRLEVQRLRRLGLRRDRRHQPQPQVRRRPSRKPRRCRSSAGPTSTAAPTRRPTCTAIQKGLISQQEADVNLKRLFKARFQLGMFDPPEMVKYAQIPFSENDSSRQPRTGAARPRASRWCC